MLYLAVNFDIQIVFARCFIPLRVHALETYNISQICGW